MALSQATLPLTGLPAGAELREGAEGGELEAQGPLCARC